MTKKQLVIASSTLLLALAVAAPTLAATNNKKSHERSPSLVNSIEKTISPSVNGTVTSVTGNAITLIDKAGTSYTIDATNAKIMKGKAVVQITDIVVGDKLMVRGTISGTNVAATTIFDRLNKPKSESANDNNGKKDNENKNGNNSSLAPKGNMSRGKVTAINGSSFALQIMNWGKDKTSTTTTLINVTTDSTTVFKKDGKPATLSDLAVGQKVLVTGVKDTTNNTISLATNVNIVTKMMKPKSHGR